MVSFHYLLGPTPKQHHHLPDVVEAFFGDSAEARQQHAAFLRAYGLSAAQVPLLRMNAFDWENPFS